MMKGASAGLFLALALLSACKPSPRQAALATAQSDVSRKLRNPGSSKFRGEIVTLEKTGFTVCGEVSGALDDQTRTPFVRFIYKNPARTVNMDPDLQSLAVQEPVLNIECRTGAASARNTVDKERAKLVCQQALLASQAKEQIDSFQLTWIAECPA